MREVKISKKTENIIIPFVQGTRTNESHQYIQLYFVESGEIVPDNFYTLKQGDTEVMCSVIGGRVRGTETLDSNQPIFLI
jgi:hypothetical protein